jgi:hypothetical protein
MNGEIAWLVFTDVIMNVMIMNSKMRQGRNRVSEHESALPSAF